MASDAELIARSLAGEGEAFVEVIRCHEAAVGAYLARRVGREFAGDLLGEVWAAALTSRGTYDPSFPDAGPWLFGVAHNTLRRHWRSRPAEEPVPDMAGMAASWDPWPAVDSRMDTDGQSTLTLAETWQSPSGPAQDVLVINASTGLPVVSMTRQPGGQASGVTYYHVARVTLADIAAGKF
jgi:DNA-directed RNA polymerase specialized sigma24 family protein